MTYLYARPVNVRIAVGQLWFAAQNSTPAFCEPGESLDRLWDDNHPYSRIWHSISCFYESCNLHSVTDADILDHLRIAMRCEHTISNRVITPERMQQSIKLWDTYGWTRYETKRAGKMRAIKQYAMPAVGLVGLCFGFVLPQP